MEHSALENRMSMQKTAKELHEKERFGEKVTEKTLLRWGGGRGCERR